MLELIALVLPLALDTFAVAAALGVAGLSSSQRLRVSLIFTSFEAGMPLIGVVIGHALGHAVGSLADYLASAALVALGAFLVFSDDDDEAEKVSSLARIHGLAIIGLGISISLDELAIGFSIGLLHLPLVWAIVLIAAQAFVAAQLGMRLGGRVGARFPEHGAGRRRCPDRARYRAPLRAGRVISERAGDGLKALRRSRNRQAYDHLDDSARRDPDGNARMSPVEGEAERLAR